MRTRLITCLGGAMLASCAFAASAAAAPEPVSYKVTGAQADVTDAGEFSADVGPVAWDSSAHTHYTLPPEGGDNDIPALPATMFPNRKNGVSTPVDVVVDGTENLTDAEGNTGDCSGVFEQEDEGFFAVLVKETGKKLQTTWEVPHGFASPRCGFIYDRFPHAFKAKGKSGGEIGDNRITLKLDGSKLEQEIEDDGVYTQTLSWKAKIVLRRIGR